MQDEKENLLGMKSILMEMQNSLISLTQMIMEMQGYIDDILIERAQPVIPDEEIDEAIRVSHTDPDIDAPIVKTRGRPRKETPTAPQRAPPEPQRAPPEPQRAPPEPPAPPVPPMPPKAPETPQIAPESATKPSIYERLLGKDADEKAKRRAERLAQLEKELAELSGKK
jgi:hypothetical protein